MRLLKAKVKNTFELQADESDCGVAVLSSIIKFHGGSISNEEIRIQIGTTLSGTTLLGLYNFSAKIGLAPEAYKAAINDLKSISVPSVLHILKNKTQDHYVVCYGFTKKGFLIGDPASGVSLMEEKELESLWHSRALLVLTPTSTFEKVSIKSYASFGWVFKALKSKKDLVNITILIGLITTTLNFASAIFTEKLVDNLIPHATAITLIVGVLSWFFLLLMSAFFSYLRENLLIRLGVSLNNQLIGGFISKLFALPKTFFDSRKKGDLISRLFDTQNIQSSIGQIISKNILDFLTALIALCILLFYDARITVYLLCVVPVYFLIIRSFHKKIYLNTRVALSSQAKNESEYIDKLSGIETIKQKNRQQKVSQELSDGFSDYQNKTAKADILNAKFRFINEVFGLLSVVFTLSYCLTEVVKGNLQIGDMLAIFAITNIAMGATGGLALATVHLQESKAALDRTHEIISIPDEKKTTKPLSMIDRIQFSDVSFGFPGRSPLLHGVKFTLKKGEVTALVGENGGGKSTILQILQKFYTPISGSILFGDTELSVVDASSLRSQLGVVPQEVKIFNNSLAYNISLSTESEEDVFKFCIEYDFHSFFEKLPHGYDTLLGEDGVKVSGGQKQLIGLARALYNNPSILLLDEVTSATDKKTEQFTLRLIQLLKKNCVVLLVTHNMKVAHQADYVYVLENGEIAQKGKPEELQTVLATT